MAGVERFLQVVFRTTVLIQQLIQGMAFGQTIDEMARGQYYIHPALPELIENALLGLA